MCIGVWRPASPCCSEWTCPTRLGAHPHLQNGLGAAFSSHLLKGRPVAYTKLAVLILNIPLIVLGARPNNLNLKVLDVSSSQTLYSPVLFAVCLCPC